MDPKMSRERAKEVGQAMCWLRDSGCLRGLVTDEAKRLRVRARTTKLFVSMFLARWREIWWEVTCEQAVPGSGGKTFQDPSKHQKQDLIDGLDELQDYGLLESLWDYQVRVEIERGANVSSPEFVALLEVARDRALHIGLSSCHI